jgi:septum formation protein
MKINNLVLASSSNYRQAILKKLHVDFKTASPDIDESPLAHEAPIEQALRLSQLKALALIDKFPDHLIIGSDQVALLNGTQLNKPGNRENAIVQLKTASGNQVGFYTGVCVVNSKTKQCLADVDICTVFFKTLTLKQIEHYVDLDQPYDCAGGFKSESLGIALFEKIQGDDPNALVGLPLIKLIALLAQFDVYVI